MLRDLAVIEPDDRELLGNRKSAAASYLDDGGGEDVVVGEDRRRPVRELDQLGGCCARRVDAVIDSPYVRIGKLDAACAQAVAEPREACARLENVRVRLVLLLTEERKA